MEDRVIVIYNGMVMEITREEYEALCNGWVTMKDMFG